MEGMAEATAIEPDAHLLGLAAAHEKFGALAGVADARETLGRLHDVRRSAGSGVDLQPGQGGGATTFLAAVAATFHHLDGDLPGLRFKQHQQGFAGAARPGLGLHTRSADPHLEGRGRIAGQSEAPLGIGHEDEAAHFDAGARQGLGAGAKYHASQLQSCRNQGRQHHLALACRRGWTMRAMKALFGSRARAWSTVLRASGSRSASTWV